MRLIALVDHTWEAHSCSPDMFVDLMDHLERKKDEAIQFTFRQVGGEGAGHVVGVGRDV